MTKTEDILRNYKPSIKVGQRVRFGSPWNRREGVVIEDRGPLGVGGRQIVRIGYGEDPSGNGNPEMAETETAAENVKAVKVSLYEFDAQGGDKLILNVHDFAGEDYVMALIVPESERPRFAPWKPGKPIGFFGPNEALHATPKNPSAQFILPTSGRWLVQVAINMGGKFELVRQDIEGNIHKADKITE